MEEGVKFKKTGLTILAIGALLLIGTGIYQLFKALVVDPDLPVLVKLGITGVIIGIIVLLISLIKERVEEVREK